MCWSLKRSSLAPVILLTLLLVTSAQAQDLAMPTQTQNLPEEEDPENTEEIIELGLGESQIITAAGIAYTAVDPTLVQIREIPPDRIELIGLRGGDTKVFYWVGEELRQFSVRIPFPSALNTVAHSGPQFRGNLPYFSYSHSNSSSFTQKQFYQNPFYGHGLSAQTPLWGNAGLTGTAQWQHQQGFTEDKLKSGRLVYRDSTRRFTFGQAISSLGKENSALSGVSVFGSELQFKYQGSAQRSHELTFFGGPEQPGDLRDPSTQNQVYGGNYYIFSPSEKSIYGNYTNLSAFGYQLTGTQEFRPGFVLENNTHLTPTFSFASGVARGEGGYSLVAKPTWERPRGITSFRHSYINDGLQGVQSGRQSNDAHATTFAHQTLSEDLMNLWSANVLHNLSLRRESSTSPSSSNLNGQIAFKRSRTFRQNYGIQYTGSRSASGDTTTFSNGLGSSLTYIVGKNGSLSHSFGGSVTNGSSTSYSANTGHTFSIENTHVRSDTSLSFQESYDTQSQESLTLQQNLQTTFKWIALQLNTTYNKSDLRDNIHLVGITPTLQIFLTSVQQLSLSGNTSFSMGEKTSMTGSLNIGYQYYFGPAVVPDPLWKRLFFGGQKAPVGGILYLDNNYNFYFDHGDTPLESVTVLLNGKKTTTNKEGEFQFDRVASGKQTLKLPRENIPLKEILEYSDTQSFNTNGQSRRITSIPIQIPKGEIHVLLLSDSNDNKAVDSTDLGITLPKVILVNSEGTRKEIRPNQGGLAIKGLEAGSYIVTLDPMDLPDNQELHSPLEQKITLTDLEKREVSFLFLPFRTVRGQINVGEGEKRPSGLSIHLGKYRSQIDSEGYYRIQQLSPGEYPITFQNLPKNYCLSQNTREKIQIPEGPYADTVNIELTTKCNTEPQIINEPPPDEG